MHYFFRFINLLLIVSLFSCFLEAQPTPWSLQFLIGPTYYIGDLTDGTSGVLQGKKMTLGLSAEKPLNNQLSLQFAVKRGQLALADDSFPDDPIRSMRSFEFHTTFTDFQSLVKVQFLQGRAVKPSIGAGLGFVVFDPTTDFTGNTIVELDPGIKTDLLANFNKSSFFIPLHAAVNYQIDRKWALNGGLQFNFTFTDYLDGISHAGDPATNDHYGMVYLGLAYQFYTIADADGDGIADAEDLCPLHPGVALLAGCPDSDGDGIGDKEDQCPYAAGYSTLTGCPDSDSDGVPDPYDRCPSVPGPEAAQGCPVLDSDGDGVEDHLDDCPLVKGPAERKGCPAIDTDRDGILDEDDRCPTIFGIAIFKGCPDIDGDGIEDRLDACPTVFGSYHINGCPDYTTEEELVELLTETPLYFGESSAELKNLTSLKKLVVFLKNHRSYQLTAHGNADPTGSDQTPEFISQLRAERVRDYLTDAGISVARIKITTSTELYIDGASEVINQVKSRQVSFVLSKQ